MTWYLLDTIGASLSVGNLMLIVPLSAAGFLLLAYIAARNLFRLSGDRGEPDGRSHKAGRQVLMLALFAAYILALGHVHFDVATALFVFCLMMLINRDGAVRAAIYAVIVSLVISTTFKVLIPYYPFPMLLDLI